MAENNQYKWRQRKKRNTLITVWIVIVIVLAALATFAYDGLKESDPLNVAKKYIQDTVGVEDCEVETGARSLNNDNLFVQEYTFTYTADGKQETKKMSLVQQPDKKYGIFEKWGFATEESTGKLDVELIAPVDSQVLVDGIAPTNSEIKIDETLSPGKVCYDLTGVEDGAKLLVNGLPFDSYESSITEKDTKIDVTEKLVVGKNAQTQMEEIAKTMINELFTVAIKDGEASDLSKLFDQCANKANLLKAIKGNLFDKEQLKVESITFKEFKPTFGEVYYPEPDESAFIGMEMKLAYKCEYTLADLEPETETETEETYDEESEEETEKATEAKKQEKKTVSKEAKFYFRYIDGACIVTTIEVPNAIS